MCAGCECVCVCVCVCVVLIYTHTHTGKPHFSKVHLTPLRFYKTPGLVPVSLTRRNSKIYPFTKKGEKQKQHSTFVSAGAITEGESTMSSKSGRAKLIPWKLHSAPQHHAAIALNCVCEHLCFISIYSVYPLARRVIR